MYNKCQFTLYAKRFESSFALINHKYYFFVSFYSHRVKNNIFGSHIYASNFPPIPLISKRNIFYTLAHTLKETFAKKIEFFL